MNKITQLGSIALASSMLLLQACEQSTTTEGVAEQSETAAQVVAPIATETTVAKISAAAIELAAKKIDEADFMLHVNTLAADDFEGRAPATAGGEKTVSYLETEFKKLGLMPSFEDSYRQAVPLMELNVTNKPPLELKHNDGSSASLAYKQGSVVFTSRTGDSAEIKDSGLVFVGYGVVAPEYAWNDYAGIDMAGKTAVILVNDPGFRAPDADLFKGNTMTYYGRWTYKFEEAARQGAAGAIIVHQDNAAGYPWEVVSGSWSGPQYNLFAADGNVGNLAVESWITQPAAEQLFSKNGLNYAEMVTKAGQQGFTPIAMTSTASSRLEITSRKSDSYNVGGFIEGSVRPEELFIYTGHWDHLGVKSVADGEDAIFNGAQDNATGIAGLLEMAQAFKALPYAPERSVMFLAVTAEESGLLGSKQYAEDPAFPMNKTVAGINIDAMSTAGATDDIVVVGYGNSQMDDYLSTVATEQGRILVQEPSPEKGYFYRSDHFNLAKKGVPMLYAEAGMKVRGKPEGYGKAEAERYLAERYHKAGDEVHPEWDNGGIMQDLYAHFRIGIAISDSSDWPSWSEGNEFKAIRDASQE
ncbi:MAG: Zn-dependent M28 family amino/carboxypeptidase [Arenicella sp.]|jgi:Zn-dependent M28 family amino/carboxypeptidase